MGTILHPEGYCEETLTDEDRKKNAEEWVGKHVTALLTPRARDPMTGLPLADYSGEITQTAEDETSIHAEILLLMTGPTMTLMSVKIWNSRALPLNGRTDDVN